MWSTAGSQNMAGNASSLLVGGLMASGSSLSGQSVAIDGNTAVDEHGMTSKLSLLMDKIRSRAATGKVWPEIVKLTKATFSENKMRSGLISDPNERQQIERALDTMQRCIKVKDHKSMVERLETISRALKLKFMPGPSGREYFISSDMFYVEVVLNPVNGYVLDVKIAHQSDPTSCQELVNVLRGGNFDTFTTHLEGIASIYNLVADKKTKTKVYHALHSLETDLTILAQLQQGTSNDPCNIIHKTPVGILEPRKGGHCMKLTFFVAPYDLIDRQTKSNIPLTIENVIEKKIGSSATICIESFSERNHKLQTTSLITVSKSLDGKNLPQFAALSNLNSSSLPACFVLKLPKPLPVALELLKKISMVTGIDLLNNNGNNNNNQNGGQQQQPSQTSSSNGAGSGVQPLITLIAMSVLPEAEKVKLSEQLKKQNGHRVAKVSKCFYTKLPDQEHCYYLSNSFNSLEGMLITSIPFTHPTHVPQILVFLRQQVLFNVTIASCIRKMSSFGSSFGSKDEKCSSSSSSASSSTSSASSCPRFTFEMAHQSMTSVNVTFEHPVDESLASLDIDLKDVTSVKCKLYNAINCPYQLNESGLISEDYVTKIMQRSLSIPITLRMTIIKAKERYQQLKEAEELKQKMKDKERQMSGINSSNGSNTMSTSNADDFSNFMANYNNANRSGHQQQSVAPAKVSTPPTNLPPATVTSDSIDSPMVQLLQNLNTQQQLLKAAVASAEVATTTGNLAVASSLASEIRLRQTMVQRLVSQISKKRQVEAVRSAAAASVGAMATGSSLSGSGSSKSGLTKQQQLKAQQNNAMLLNMLQDLPSATVSNPSTLQQQQLQLYNLFQQKVQQLDKELGQQQVPVKKPRKRRNAASDGSSSVDGTSAVVGPSKPGRGGKRKVTERDVSNIVKLESSDIFAADYSSALMSGAGSSGSGIMNRPSSSSPSLFHAGSSSSSSPRSSTSTPPTGSRPTSSATAAALAAFERQRSLDELLAGAKEGAEGPNQAVMSLLQRSLSANAGGVDVSNVSDMAQTMPRKRQGRGRSTEELALNYDDGNNPFAVDTSDAYHYQRPSSVGPVPSSSQKSGAKRSTSNDGNRRCSSAGIGEPIRRGPSPASSAASAVDGDDATSSLLSPLVVVPVGGAVTVKKERKRKRSESVDSIKNVSSTGSSTPTSVSSPSSGLMPPPLVTSSGEATSGQSTGNVSPNVYKFSDTLRSTLSNVSKALGMTATSTSGSSKPGPKKLSLVSSTGPSSLVGPKGTKNEAKLKILKGMMDMASQGLGLPPESVAGMVSPGSSLMVGSVRVSGSGTPRMGQSGPKYVKPGAGGPKSAAAGSRFKSPQGHVSSSSSPSLSSKSHFSIGMQLTSPPVSSSSTTSSAPSSAASVPSSASSGSSSASILSSPTITSGPPPDFGVSTSSTKVPSSPVASSGGGQQPFAGQGKAGKRTLGSLASVIDKLASKNTTSSTTPSSASSSGTSTSGQPSSSDLSSVPSGGDVSMSSPSPSDADSSASRPGPASTKGPGSKFVAGQGSTSSTSSSTKGGPESSFKASISGSGKLTISKTKPATSSDGQPIKTGPRMKIGTGMKGPAATSSTGPKMKIGTGMKQRPGIKSIKGQGSSGISSSSSSSGSILSSSPRSGGTPTKSLLNRGKVSSSGSSSSSKSSDISSSGLGAILNQALGPKLRLDQLPKIPKTPASVAAAAAAAAAAEAARNAPPPAPSAPQPSFGSSTSSSGPSSSSSMGPPQSVASSSQSSGPQSSTFQQQQQQPQRRLSRDGQPSSGMYQPLPSSGGNNFGVHQPVAPSSSNVQLDPRIESSSSSNIDSQRFQSSAITSSHGNNGSGGNSWKQESSIASSSGAVIGSRDCDLRQLTSSSMTSSSSSSSAADEKSSGDCDSSDTNTDTKVRSSGDAIGPRTSSGQRGPSTGGDDGPEEPTSTPSSPVESGSGDHLAINNPPPIIPIESFDAESDDRGDEASPSLMISDVIDSSDNVSSPDRTSTGHGPSTSSGISSSVHRQHPTPSVKMAEDEDDDDDDEDGDGLVIADDEPSTPSSVKDAPQESSTTSSTTNITDDTEITSSGPSSSTSGHLRTSSGSGTPTKTSTSPKVVVSGSSPRTLSSTGSSPRTGTSTTSSGCPRVATTTSPRTSTPSVSRKSSVSSEPGQSSPSGSGIVDEPESRSSLRPTSGSSTPPVLSSPSITPSSSSSMAAINRFNWPTSSSPSQMTGTSTAAAVVGSGGNSDSTSGDLLRRSEESAVTGSGPLVPYDADDDDDDDEEDGQDSQEGTLTVSSGEAVAKKDGQDHEDDDDLMNEALL